MCSRRQPTPANDDFMMNEESFCSNFVCCGIYLADLHALLQHYEEHHVRVDEDAAVEDGQVDAADPYTQLEAKRRRLLTFGGTESNDWAPATGADGRRAPSAFDTTVLRPVMAAESKSSVPWAPRPVRPAPTNTMPQSQQAALQAAAAAASSALRAALPPSMLQGTNAEDNHFRLIYSILSQTLQPASGPGGGGASPTTNAPTAAPTPKLAPLQVPTASAPKPNIAHHLRKPKPPVDKSLERPYICPQPGCGKTYKNPNGLKYHLQHGHDASNELAERPHVCPVTTCGKRYKNPNGLKYHLQHAHEGVSLPAGAASVRPQAPGLRGVPPRPYPRDPGAPILMTTSEEDESDQYDVPDEEEEGAEEDTAHVAAHAAAETTTQPQQH